VGGRKPLAKGHRQTGDGINERRKMGGQKNSKMTAAPSPSYDSRRSATKVSD